MNILLSASTGFNRFIERESVIEVITHHRLGHRLVHHLIAWAEDLDWADLHWIRRGLRTRAILADASLLLGDRQVHTCLVELLNHDLLLIHKLLHDFLVIVIDRVLLMHSAFPFVAQVVSVLLLLNHLTSGGSSFGFLDLSSRPKFLLTHEHLFLLEGQLASLDLSLRRLDNLTPLLMELLLGALFAADALAAGALSPFLLILDLALALFL